MNTSESKIKSVKLRLKQYDRTAALMEQRQTRQERLKSLVNEHGVEIVSIAAGISENTVQQYCRVSVAPSMSENSILQAEKILKDL